ncbi:MAG: HNH endonuclease family protein [Acidobacteriota bacterium]
MKNNPTTSHKATTKSILDLQNLFKLRHLNLEPGFQRQSVWTERDRAKLIESILRNYPLPAIFLYKREVKGHLVFDVIDGKQRLESIFMFMGAMRGRFWSRAQLPTSDTLEWVDWTLLKRRGLQHLITGYEIPVIEVDGEMGEIIDVFVRINSTGKALTQQEKRHARYYDSPFLKEAARLGRRFEDYFLTNHIFSSGQISRMKHVELICELMLSLVQGDVLNKKTALDRVMATSSFDGRQLGKATRMVISTLNRVKRMFPHLKSTRFRQVTDFYTLAWLIGRFEQEGLILTDRRRNQLAWDLLVAFGVQVDHVRELQRKAKGAKADQELYRDYLLTVSQMTDDVSQRRKRAQILSNIIRSLFATKDSQRGFTSEQRRIMWNASSTRSCSYPRCNVRLTWDDFTIDHISPHSKGGQSRLENAALMCRKHNSKKGNRRR